MQGYLVTTVGKKTGNLTTLTMRCTKTDNVDEEFGEKLKKTAKVMADAVAEKSEVVEGHLIIGMYEINEGMAYWRQEFEKAADELANETGVDHGLGKQETKKKEK